MTQSDSKNLMEFCSYSGLWYFLQMGRHELILKMFLLKSRFLTSSAAGLWGDAGVWSCG